MNNPFSRKVIAAFALLFPVSMWADITDQTVTLTANQTLKFDTGATGTSGGDVQYQQSELTFQGSATGFNVPGGGSSVYSALNQSLVTQFGSQFTSAPITGLAVDGVFAVHTNGGNYAKALITAVSASSITLKFTTYGSTGGGGTGGGTSGGPTISAIQNNYSNIVAGLPNYGIAPGTLFVIYGSGMADPTAKAELQDTTQTGGIPTTLNGAQISINGMTTHAGIYYATATQIAAVLPSSTQTGTATVTVSYNGQTSAAFSIKVVPSALGFDTLYGTGTGLGVATEGATVLNYNQSAKPGDVITLWGSGLGADTADSDVSFSTSPHAVSVPLQIYVGGVQATINYQGSSGYPGLNQINVTIPQNVQIGCAVSVVAQVNDIVSNVMTIPVAAGGGVCSDPVLGQDGSQILSLGGKTNYTQGTLFVFQSTSPTETDSVAAGDFYRYQGAQSGSGYGLVSLGSCIINTSSGTNTSSPFTTTGLDAGIITVTGPTGTQPVPAVTFGGTLGLYETQLPSGFIPATGGTFTFNGTGGKDIGAFTASVTYINPMNWTNRTSITSINRSQGLNLTWTGGASGTYVIIEGSSSDSAGTNASFTCYAPANAQQFTVPSYILSALPAGSGDLSLFNYVNPQTFSASNLDQGIIAAAVSFDISPNYQ